MSEENAMISRLTTDPTPTNVWSTLSQSLEAQMTNNEKPFVFVKATCGDDVTCILSKSGSLATLFPVSSLFLPGNEVALWPSKDFESMLTIKIKRSSIQYLQMFKSRFMFYALKGG